jgi:DNA mismatch endonuclease (patch repair protein)
VKAYYETLDKFGLGKFDNEGNIRRAFESLLEKCARPFDWFVVGEYQIARTGKSRLRVDATMLDAFNLPRGYWEAKDEKDDLKAEVNEKFAAGYARTNILFQKPTQAILARDGSLAFRRPPQRVAGGKRRGAVRSFSRSSGHMDNLSKPERSERMSRIKGADTGPEMIVRRLVHGMGFRYRLHARDLPGIPDIVFPKLGKIIFVHGCFWHQHPSCGRQPKSHLDFWTTKLFQNRERDFRNQRKLRSLPGDS